MRKYSIPYTYIYTYRDESVVEVLRGLCGTGILIAFTDGPWSDDLMASDNKWRPMIDAVLYTQPDLLYVHTHTNSITC